MFNKNKYPEENRACAYCEKAEVIGDSGACICELKGIVHGDSICRRFSFDLLKYKPRVTKLPLGDMNFDID